MWAGKKKGCWYKFIILRTCQLESSADMIVDHERRQSRLEHERFRVMNTLSYHLAQATFRNVWIFDRAVKGERSAEEGGKGWGEGKG